MSNAIDFKPAFLLQISFPFKVKDVSTGKGFCEGKLTE